MRPFLTCFMGVLLGSALLAGCESGEAPASPAYSGSSSSSSDDGSSAPTDNEGAAMPGFCAAYADTCGLGGEQRFADMQSCGAFWDAASELTKECTQMHLSLAEGDATTHCPHATGFGPCDPAATFCAAYDTRCGFEAEGFTDGSDCTATFEVMGDAQQACVAMHLDLAEDDPGTHCPHARGQGPCAADALVTDDDGGGDEAFCAQYGTTCTFGGPSRYASLADCQAARAGMSESTRSCTSDHLALAAPDPTTHCPHATGQGPCDPAAFFCTAYEDNCSFGGPERFRNESTCRDEYGDFSPIKQACAEEHLILAASDPDTHCPHALGLGPCADVSAFCALYASRCSFDGAERFADAGDCQASLDSFTPPRLACAEQHLVLAVDDPALHCPHATGLGPCLSP